MMDAVVQLLRVRIGMDAESIGQHNIESAVRQRMAERGVDGPGYGALLLQSVAEQQALVEAVVVPETWFFRYPESFALLARVAHRHRQECAPARPLRILSLPCSTGEEPYSIAMCLCDLGFAEGTFDIDAFDVSERALGLARRALYGNNAFRGEDLGFRARHFTAQAAGYALAPRIQRTVNFACANFFDSARFGPNGHYDIIFCRNLLIYFDAPNQKRACEQIVRMLGAQGVLFVGPAEAGIFCRDGFETLDQARGFAFRYRAPRKAQALAPAGKRPSAPPHIPTPISPVRSPMRPAALQAHTAPTVQSSLAQITALANAGHTPEALAACDVHLRTLGPSAGLFYWWGLLQDSAGQTALAETHYRKALYLDPQHALTLAHYAQLLVARGDTAGAQRLQKRITEGEAHHGD